MTIHHLTVDEAFASLHSGPNGLSADEAQRRLREYGYNTVEQVRGESVALRVAKAFTHFFALVLWAAAGLAFYAAIQDPGQGMAVLGFAIVGVIVVNAVFSLWQEYRAERAIQALREMLPRQSNVVRDGALQRISSAELVPGDLIYLEGGDDVPADCRMIEGFSARVNNATVTGESSPHSRDSAPSTEAEFLYSGNVLLAGTSMVSGEARALVFATGGHTMFGQIAHLTQEARHEVSPLQREIIGLSRVLAGLALALGLLFFAIGRVIELSFWQNLMFAIGIIVANVPEGLLPTVTLALAMGAQRMAKRNALIRHLPAVETLGCTTVICTDKTGTLTQNRMTVRQLFLGGNYFPEDGIPVSLQSTYAPFFAVARHCHTVKTTNHNGANEMVGDPMEIALLRAGQRWLPDASQCTLLDEIPFDSTRKRLSTIYRTPNGLLLYTKGAPETVLSCCQTAQFDDGQRPLTPELRRHFAAAQENMAERGLRVLAFAHRSLAADYDRATAEQHLVLVGLIGLEDPPRPEVPGAIRQCQEAGIKIIMITGDHPQTAKAIAKEIGLVRSASPVVITGEQLRRLSNTQLQLKLDAPEILFARVAADQKMRIVSVLKKKREIVAVTGDGVNDAPALRKADIGVAMGCCGTDVAREAADMILLDDNFASIVAAIEEGRAVYANIRKFLTYILTSNVPELVPYLAFILTKIPLPLTIIQILVVDLGTDMVPALALGAEPPHPRTMKHPPRSQQDHLLNGRLLLRAYAWLGVLESIAALAAFFFVLTHGGWRYGESLGIRDPLYLQATTACLSAIIVMQVANVFACRSRRQSVFRFGLFSNPLILWGIAAELALILFIDYTRWGNTTFGTAPLPWTVWLFAVPFALAMVALEEARKWLVRRVWPSE